MLPPELQGKLEIQRETWERGQKMIEHKETQHCSISLMQCSEGLFYVYRYFFVSDKCHASCDANAVTEREAWKALVAAC